LENAVYLKLGAGIRFLSEKSAAQNCFQREYIKFNISTPGETKGMPKENISGYPSDKEVLLNRSISLKIINNSL
jgi:hypothetical protein